jgi:hypothetical protein
MIENVNWSSCTVLHSLVDFNETSSFSTNLRKTVKYQISRKSLQYEPSCSMRTDTQTDRTDMTKLAVASRNSANAPRNSTFCGHTESTCLYGPHDKQQLFPFTAATDKFL